MASPAPTLKALWDEAHARWPDQTRFDGIMGDTSHQARKSDHNDGNALDIGIIPASSDLGYEIAERLIRDDRCKYVIWDRRIWSHDRAAEGWRPYSGASPHTEHVHLSIPAWARDDMRPWLDGTTEEADLTAGESEALIETRDNVRKITVLVEQLVTAINENLTETRDNVRKLVDRGN